MTTHRHRLPAARVASILVSVLVIALVSGCGSPATTSLPLSTTRDTTSAAPTTAVTTAVAASDPITVAPTTTAAPADPTTISWLTLSTTPAGLRLVGARRELVATCGPMEDCAATMPRATLTYDTDDATQLRSLQIGEARPIAAHDADPYVVVGGTQAWLGHRVVNALVIGSPPLQSISASWTDTNGAVVRIDATGITMDALDAIVGTLQPADPAAWPGDDAIQTRLGQCVDSTTQYAPTYSPPGWTQFVLQARPTGDCTEGALLMMSFGDPTTTGTLVTIVSQAASPTLPPPSGQAITIDGRDATLQTATGADGRTGYAIHFVAGAASIDVHGNADLDTMRHIAAGVVAVTDAQWATLVASIATPG